MPHKDPEQRRAYHRKWYNENKHKNIERDRAHARKHAKLYRIRHPDTYRQRLETARDRYCKLKHKCRRTGVELRLTSEQYTALIAGASCHYCNMPLSKTGCGLDRINNEPYYSPENVVACCHRCNIVFNRLFSYEERLMLAVVIREVEAKRALSPERPHGFKQNSRAMAAPSEAQGQLFR
jgi:hypothetical protein